MKIALFGKMRSGKDTVANILKEKYKCTGYAFGDGIANIIKEYFPEDWAKGKPRKHYQHIGQELRKLNPDVWVNYMLKQIEHDNNYYLRFGVMQNDTVITDGRQVNEAMKLKELGYYIVKVECPEKIRLDRIKNAGDLCQLDCLQHETELNIDRVEADYTLVNDGTLEELTYKVDELVGKIRGAV